MLAKQETLQLKGAAILIMVFLHLFNRASNVDLCDSFFFINGVPLVSLLSKFTMICVSLYLFLSGYGLYITFQKEVNLHPWKRILKLYINFWIVFLVFIFWGSWLRPDLYPGNWVSFLNNLTGWDTTYNEEWWFLFPYVLLVLSSKFIFSIIKRFCFFKLVLIIGCVFIFSYFITWLNIHYWHVSRYLHMLILYISLLSSFSIGAIFVKYDIDSQLRERFPIRSIYSNILAILVFILLLALRIMSPIDTVNIIYLVLFVSWFIVIRKARWVIWCLEKLGEQSTNMWLVHTFFCYYLFHDWIYGFKYPIVIYAVTVLVSYFTGYLIDKINHPVQRYVIGKLWKTTK